MTVNENAVWPTLEELEGRWLRLQEKMSASNMDGALFFQNADLVYLCGTTIPLAVFIPRDGSALVFVRRWQERSAARIGRGEESDL